MNIVALALLYHFEPSRKRRCLIRLAVFARPEPEQKEFDALVCALGWRIWES